jgi:hypothetical protein
MNLDLVLFVLQSGLASSYKCRKCLRGASCLGPAKFLVVRSYASSLLLPDEPQQLMPFQKMFAFLLFDLSVTLWSCYYRLRASRLGSVKSKGSISQLSRAMIRLPATTIVLGRADIKDFESRRKYATQEGRLERTFHQDSNGILHAPHVVPIRVRDKSLYGSVEQLTALETYMPSRPKHDDNKECSTHDVKEIKSDDSGSSSSLASTPDHLLTGSVENVAMGTPTFSASKDNFEYGGYTEQLVATNIESPAIPHGKFLVPQMQHYTNVLDDSLCWPEFTIHRAPKTSTTTGQIPLGHLA